MTTPALDATDRAIINRLQDGLPLSERPYREVAAELGLGEEALIERLQTLLDDGALSRFGPMYNAERLGGAFCLAALAVPPERFDEVARAVNAFDEVAHNYRREHELNMWFVLATEDPRRIREVIGEIERATDLAVYDFPKLDEYYVRFRLEV